MEEKLSCNCKASRYYQKYKKQIKKLLTKRLATYDLRKEIKEDASKDFIADKISIHTSKTISEDVCLSHSKDLQKRKPLAKEERKITPDEIEALKTLFKKKKTVEASKAFKGADTSDVITSKESYLKRLEENIIILLEETKSGKDIDEIYLKHLLKEQKRIIDLLKKLKKVRESKETESVLSIPDSVIEVITELTDLESQDEKKKEIEELTESQLQIEKKEEFEESSGSTLQIKSKEEIEKLMESRLGSESEEEYEELTDSQLQFIKKEKSEPSTSRITFEEPKKKKKEKKKKHVSSSTDLEQIELKPVYQKPATSKDELISFSLVESSPSSSVTSSVSFKKRQPIISTKLLQMTAGSSSTLPSIASSITSSKRKPQSVISTKLLEMPKEPSKISGQDVTIPSLTKPELSSLKAVVISEQISKVTIASTFSEKKSPLKKKSSKLSEKDSSGEESDIGVVHKSKGIFDEDDEILKLLESQIITDHSSADSKLSKKSKELKESKDSKELLGSKESKELRKLEELKESEELKEVKEVKAIKELKKTRELRKLKKRKELKESEESKISQLIESERKDQNELYEMQLGKKLHKLVEDKLHVSDDQTDTGYYIFKKIKQEEESLEESVYYKDVQSIFKSAFPAETSKTDVKTISKESVESYFPFPRKLSNIRRGPDNIYTDLCVYRSTEYMNKHYIEDVFKFLGAHLIANSPDNPIIFLISLLDNCLNYRQGLEQPPLLFKRHNIESICDSLDPMKTGFIEVEQYFTGMQTLSIKNFNKFPRTNNMGLIDRSYFIDEALKQQTINLNNIIRIVNTETETFSSGFNFDMLLLEDG